MSEQAEDGQSYIEEKRPRIKYIAEIVGWLTSCLSLIVIVLIAYWAIKIPEKNINNLPIIKAISGDIRFQPDNPGGKSFNNEDLSIYQGLENKQKIPEKNDIVLKKVNKNFADLQIDIKKLQPNGNDKQDISLAIEDALREVVSTPKDINIKQGKNQKKGLKLYLGSFDTFAQASEFKEFIQKRNKKLLKGHKLEIFNKPEGDKKTFRVQLLNIVSEGAGKKLCAILSSRQFSCLLFNESGEY
jgi:uncharacterized protein YoxC